MSLRVGTKQAYDSATAALLRQQAELQKTQQQLATGQRMTAPGDDPIGAARAVQVESGLARNDRFVATQTAARNALTLTEATLTSVTQGMQDLRTLMIAAGNGAYGDLERRNIAAELRVRRQDLLALANARDADGRYLFGGFQERTQPFVDTPAGVAYQSDNGRRSLQVADSLTMPITVNGMDVFQRVPTGNGVFATAANAANTGSGAISIGQVVDATLLDGHSYELAFHVAGGVTTYDVLDTTSAAVVSSGNAYQPGTAIAVAGMQVTVSGTPAEGDRFSLAPSVNRNVFDALSDLIGILETPASTPAARAELSMGIARALTHIDFASERVMIARTEAGANLNQLDALGNVAADRDLGYRGELSQLRDLDYAQAATTLARQQLAIEASQQAFAKTSGKTLFDLL